MDGAFSSARGSCRFHSSSPVQPGLSDRQAGAYMLARVEDAYDKWTTAFYDVIQYIQNKIPH